jgi:SAM-dependent methyltransferase
MTPAEQEAVAGRKVDYDDFADIYDIWTATAPVTARNLPFYIEEYLRTEGPVVELGVGNGRIAIEAARRGKAVIGVDSSPRMLARCRERAAAAGVADRITLLEADFRDFVLDRPAGLVAIPFHTVGHLTTHDARRAAFARIHSQLAPGGRLIFDHFVFDPEIARRLSAPQLRAEYVNPETGRETLLWVYVRLDLEARTMRIVAWTDELDAASTVVGRRYHRLSFSWIDPEEVEALLADTGFTIEQVYGEFDRRPAEGSSERIWVARRPA